MAPAKYRSTPTSSPSGYDPLNFQREEEQMRKSIVCTLVCMMVAVGLIACSGGGGGGNTPACAAPALDATGTWCITITSTNNTCGNLLDTTPYFSVFTQNGSNISATSQQGATFSGLMCGSTTNMSGTSFGFNTSVDVAFSDASHATGTSSYSNATCHGTDTISAVSGTCP